MALRLRTEPEWRTFLQAAAIPENESDTYAKKFTNNRINETNIVDIDKQLLIDLGITVLGDILSILRHTKTTVSSDGTTSTPQPQSFKPPSATAKLPTLTSEMTHPQFRKFKVDWDVYKKITGLPLNQIPTHLYSTCDEAVQTSLINTLPNFSASDETTLLTTLESIVTKRVNPTIHRMTFASILQQEHESIQDFAIRLRSAAVNCEFSCPNCVTDLSKFHIKDQFVRGLHNNVLQTDILVKANHLKTLGEIINHVEAFETALRDQSKLQSSSDVLAARTSDYQRQKSGEHHKPKTCSGCGSTSHGTPGSKDRATKCPAWGKICKNCNITNHFASVCRQPSSNGNIMIAHVQYDAHKDTYTTLSNNNIEEIPATITQLLSRNTSSTRCTKLNIYPDSGASICLAGPKHLAALGVKPHTLLPCHKKVTAVGGSTLFYKGWLPIEFNIGEHRTKQPLYICDKIDRIYFSKHGCMETQILPKSFPYPIPRTSTAASISTNPTTEPRTSAPPRPMDIPF